MQHKYSFQSALAASEKVNWRVEDLIGGNKQLDFRRPFLPDSLAGVKDLTFLTQDERRVLNQIRGNEYLVMFGLVEEFIIPYVLDHARPRLMGDNIEVRALLNFAEEEAKHIHLFRRFREEFEKGFGVHCEVIGPPEAIAEKVLAHDKLAVAILIMHIEWMTQRHYTDSVEDDSELDPQFKSLLKHHWMEEAQHARMDTLIVEELASKMSGEQIARALDEYLEIGAFLDGGLGQQVEFNLDSFRRATGRQLAGRELEEYRKAQTKALRWTYIGSAMTHANFLETLGQIQPAARARVEEVSLAFC